MHMRSSCLSVAFLAMAAQLAAAAAIGDQKKVSATSFFANDGRRVIYIETAPDETLVFDETDNSRYVLQGRYLEIRAKTVELQGNVTIRAFNENDRGLDDHHVGDAGANGANGVQGSGDGGGGSAGQVGSQGGQGQPGGDGKGAKRVRLYVESLAGTGKLTIANKGMPGGKGGEGGKGGTGGCGGKGADRTGSNGPGNGGRGGDGGVGGVGGTGGTGGVGGNIEITLALCPAIKNHRIELVANGGSGGLGGIGGTGGAGGCRGEGGGGGLGGGGGTPSEPGTSHENDRGQTGTQGSNGNPGRLVCMDCPTKACE